jgi:peptide/nickel transport system permease protein
MNFREIVQELLKTRTSAVGLVLILAFLLLAVFGSLLAPHDPFAQDLYSRLQRPDRSHPFGTDDFGRDLLSRVMAGARISLRIGVVSVGIALAVGTLVGLLAGYYGGWVDNLLMRAMDIMLAFPSILLSIVVVAILGPSLTNAMIAVGIVVIPQYARVVRASVLSIKEMEYVQAARALGYGDRRILRRSVLPNCLPPLMVQSTLGMATAILDAAGLSFLGLGAQPPTPEWGAMLSQGRDSFFQAPWIMTYPGLAILLTVLGFNLLGDGLRDVLDPRL